MKSSSKISEHTKTYTILFLFSVRLNIDIFICRSYACFLCTFAIAIAIYPRDIFYLLSFLYVRSIRSFAYIYLTTVCELKPLERHRLRHCYLYTIGFSLPFAILCLFLISVNCLMFIHIIQHTACVMLLTHIEINTETKTKIICC